MYVIPVDGANGPTENAQQRNESAGGAKCGCPKNRKKKKNVFLFLLFELGWVIYPDVIHLYPPHTRIQSNFQLFSLFFFSFFFLLFQESAAAETISYFYLNRNITQTFSGFWWGEEKNIYIFYYWILKSDGQTILIS